MPEDATIDQLNNVRDTLLDLHKILLEYQKHSFESTQHRIISPAHYFEVVTSHPDFVWLKTLSELIVSVDILLDGKDFDAQNAKDMLAYTRKLLKSQEPLNDFGKKYLEALRHDPAVALAHAQAMKALE